MYQNMESGTYSISLYLEMDKFLKKNIGRNPIVDCERNGERKEINRIENEMKVQLENGNKSPFTNWKYNSN